MARDAWLGYRLPEISFANAAQHPEQIETMTHVGAPSGKAVDAQRRLVRALCNPRCYPHAVGAITIIETHISLVVLTGTFAYKIKKPLNLGFLDFTTLAKRRFYCEEELRLNRRLAPRIYLDVVAIGGTPDKPLLDGRTAPIEYAVRMIEFPQGNILDRMLDRGGLAPRHLDALASTVAEFHARAARAGQSDGYGTAEAILAPMEQNFAQIRALLDQAEDHQALDALESWCKAECSSLRGTFSDRLHAGFVRECHGDLHLGNIVLIDDDPQVFDCIEFNPGLRWIDIINEIAFLVMDLTERGRADYAHRFLNGYLEIVGDYAGLRLLHFYLAYRAMVRAKIARIRASQDVLGPDERKTALAAYAAYIACAGRMIAPRPCALMIMHGPSGSGKTFVAQGVVEAIGAVRIRSDVERKRLHSLPPLGHSGSGVGSGIYDEASTRAVYDRLAHLARLAVGAGFPTVIDATFLKRWQRNMFCALAHELAVPFLILDCQAPETALRERVAKREAKAADASEATLAVLGGQLSTAEAIDAEETGAALRVDTEKYDIRAIVEKMKRRVGL